MFLSIHNLPAAGEVAPGDQGCSRAVDGGYPGLVASVAPTLGQAFTVPNAAFVAYTQWHLESSAGGEQSAGRGLV